MEIPEDECGPKVTSFVCSFVEISGTGTRIRYLGEDYGERLHEEESRNESQVGAVVNLAKKERTKSQFEAMKKSAMVKETMSEFKQKSKRNFIIDGPSQAENIEMERKRLIEEQRDELLLSPLLDGTRILLSDIKSWKIMND